MRKHSKNETEYRAQKLLRLHELNSKTLLSYSLAFRNTFTVWRKPREEVSQPKMHIEFYIYIKIEA